MPLRRRRAARPGLPPHRPRPIARRRGVDLAFAELPTAVWPMDVEDNAFLALAVAIGWRRLAARVVDRVEEPVLLRGDARARQVRGDRPRRQLRPGAADVYEMGPEMGPPTTTSWEWPPGDDSWPHEMSDVIDVVRGVPGSGSAPRSTTPSPCCRSSRRRTGDDHHPDPAAHLPRRRRHRPAHLLPRSRTRLPHRGGDHEVRVHRRAPQLRRRRAAEVLVGRARRPGRGRRAPAAARMPAVHRHPVRGRDHVDGRHPGGYGPRLLGLVHRRRAQGAAPPPARPRLQRRSRRARPATSRSTASASRSASRTSTSPRSAGSRRSSSTPTRRSRW